MCRLRTSHQEPKSINHRYTRHPAFVNQHVRKLYNSVADLDPGSGVFLPPDPG
jgi:hypothetical protein